MFLSGVLVFCDVGAVAWAGFIATAAMLFTVGFVEQRVRAVAWAAILVASAFSADFLWQLDWEPFNRSDDYEAIPQTPFLLIGLPIPMSVIAVGAGARAFLAPHAITAEGTVSHPDGRVSPEGDDGRALGDHDIDRRSSHSGDGPGTSRRLRE